jgi:murein DD-endopeptidase MepM/ murein hydrolase activator NlpD
MREIEGLEGDPTSEVLTSPVGNAKVTSEYGADRTNCAVCSDSHAGTDFGVATGTNVESTAAGTVVRSGWSSSYGNVIIVDHGQQAGGTDNVYTLYAHLSTRDVAVGAEVTVGQVLGQSGNTGNSTGAHLHYEVIVSPAADALTTAFYSDNRTRNRTELPVLLNGNVQTVQNETVLAASVAVENNSNQSQIVKKHSEDQQKKEGSWWSDVKNNWSQFWNDLSREVNNPYNWMPR